MRRSFTKWGSISNYVKKITEKPDAHKPFMNAVRAWFWKRAADPSAAWRDLLNAAKEAATTVDEQTTAGVQQLVRSTFVEESAYAKYYNCQKEYGPLFNQNLSVAIGGEQKMGYWVK